jgi:large subunit ribosomal protein L10
VQVFFVAGGTMPKPQKIEAVKELTQNLKDSDAALLAEFRGLKVQEMKELRRKLAEQGAEFQVVKNTLTRLAVKEANLEGLLPLLEGSTAITFVKGDPIAAAKGLDEIARKYPALVLKGGLVEGKVLDADSARALARVKPREQLLTDLAGLLQAPLQSLAVLLTGPVRQLGYVFDAYIKTRPAEEQAPPQAEEQAPAVQADDEEAAVAAETEAQPEEPSETEAPAETEPQPEATEPAQEETTPQAQEQSQEEG